MKWSYVLIISILLLSAAVLFTTLSNTKTTTSSQNLIVFDEAEYDFGVIKQSGGVVTHKFAFTYLGDIERKVIAVPGSCACTTAEIDTEVLTPGSKGILTVSFDPNLHEEPDGNFFKTVAILTDPPLPKDAEVKVWEEINLDLGSEFFKLSSHGDEEIHMDEHGGQNYKEIHADELKSRLANKDFFLLDVHIPEQEHIEQTDTFIPFNEIESQFDKLPEDKNTEIIAYCRSGSMSQVAAQTLIDMGYTNVSYLEGGVREYNKQ